MIVEEDIIKELSPSEPALINALYDCYKHSELVARVRGEKVVIKTPHNLKKYLGSNIELQPLYLPLMKKLEKD